jgi:hypothetical protein
MESSKMTGNERQELFWEHMPHPFLGEALRGLFKAYDESAQYCRQFDESEELNLRPFHRRALFERNFRAAANGFPERVSAKAIRFQNKGFWFHTKVVAGRVGMTQCAAGEPEAVVRPANYRRYYAGSHNQIWLIPDANPDADLDGKMLYAIFTYGRSNEAPVRPGFAEIRFPSATLSTDLPGTIDLFAEFPEIVEEMTVGTPWEFGAQTPDLTVEPELLDDAQEDVG